MKKLFAILNALILAFTLMMNYYVNSQGINGNTIGEISDKYYNLFTPADYAFSIWGLIFLGLTVLVVSQLLEAFWGSHIDHKISEIGPWLIFANLANGLWTYVWLMEWGSLSVFLMLIILLSLIRIAQEINLQLNTGSWNIKLTLYWPIGIYLGWISVATIANISAYLTMLQLDLWNDDLLWTVGMILVAAILNLYMVQQRNMTTFGWIGIWALIAIAVRHWDTEPLLQWMSLTSAFIILITILLGGKHRRLVINSLQHDV